MRLLVAGLPGRTLLAGSVDLACALAVLALGEGVGAAQVIGAAAGTIAFHAAGSDDPMSPPGARVSRNAALALVALGLRGGVVATALSLGAPAWLATVAGAVTNWVAVGFGSSWPARALWAGAILAAGVALRACYLAVAPLLPEEAYYWNYAEHLDIGYVDHPPLVAWLIALGGRLLGHSVAGVRIGSFVCGLVTVYFVHRFCRRLVDPGSALAAVAALVVIPYFSFAGGILILPEAPLLASWAASLYFLHRALVGGERTAWLMAGVALGFGLLSKYTIALLGLGALAYVLLDKPSRRWLSRFEPYAALVIAIAIFSPALAWNYQHDWASFVFQGSRRVRDPAFSLHEFVINVLMVATPLVLVVPALLRRGPWTRDAQATPDPALATPGNQLFVACMILAPLLVFVVNAVTERPRLNWTGPLWLAALPAIGWVATHGDALRWTAWGERLRRGTRGFIVALLVFDAAVLFYLVTALPGVPYPESASQSVGWATATGQIRGLHDRLMEETGRAPVIVGMNKYFAAAQLSYHDAASNPASRMKVTTLGVVFPGNGLNFELWDNPRGFNGRDFIMVAEDREDLASSALAGYFRELHPDVREIPMVHDGPGGDRRLIDRYYYRIGFGYRSPARAGSQ